ncbi:hypothetical protein EVAR_23058_1 [Eumeta japonica]|uniref:Uncharacterized protein n=1 Tax=Eumeta variegata TaxID=151549 RepID=A0A4C1VM46_EUMVA|nr:hypothetical protein EVAR_23058_1 [Eumeta japonica]
MTYVAAGRRAAADAAARNAPSFVMFGKWPYYGGRRQPTQRLTTFYCRDCLQMDRIYSAFGPAAAAAACAGARSTTAKFLDAMTRVSGLCTWINFILLLH